MYRTSSILIFGFVAVVLIGAMSATALWLGRGYFTVAEPTAVIPTPLVVETTAAATASATAVSGDVTATAVPTLAATVVSDAPVTPPATTVPATTISVLTTSVQYVTAVTDVNMRGGPGTTYNVIGWVAAGQIARVTGVSSDNGWWRVMCPNDTIGNCWVTANTNYTRPTNEPGGSQTPTTTAPCTNSAALVADVTVPDGAQFAPYTGFNKTWRIKNTGTCTWDSSYRIAHVGGHLLDAVSTYFPLRDSVFPGQTSDLTINMVSPAVPGTYQSDWKLQNAQGQLFGVGRNDSPFWVKIVVTGELNTTISGLIYQDANQNGVYDSGETLMGSREVWLVPGTACHVRSEAVAIALSGADGRYTLSGNFNGSYCVGLAGSDGLDDVAGIAVIPGQTLNNINLRAPVPNGSISGWLWNDYCLVAHGGGVVDGNCVPDGNGSYHADGMIQPTETYIAGVTILLQLGPCANNQAVPVSAVTDASGRYTFNNLTAGTYCVSMNAASPENIPLLLPGDWTFPARGIWYQEIMLQAGDSAYPVNFGWDYQLQ